MDARQVLLDRAEGGLQFIQRCVTEFRVMLLDRAEGNSREI
jgi:hypothetical protein